jgi:hypothetical protein
VLEVWGLHRNLSKVVVVGWVAFALSTASISQAL